MSAKMYLTAVTEGLSTFGLNGFCQMHQDICEGKMTPWQGNLRILNELTLNQFNTLLKYHSAYNFVFEAEGNDYDEDYKDYI